MAQEATNGGAENGAANAAAVAVTFSALKPQLYVAATKANDAVEFYKAAFGAEEVNRTVHPKRKADQEIPTVLSAEVKLGASSFIVCDIVDDSPAPTGFTFCLETDNVAAAVEKAVAAGAVVEGEIAESEEACCGGVMGKLKDPYGYIWTICSPAKRTADVEEA